MNGDLLQALAHELRNSIAPVINAVHLIRLRSGKDPEMPGILAIIDRQLAAMTRTLDSVTLAERLSRGDVTLQRQPVDLCAALQSAVQACRPLIDSRRQRVRVVSEPRPMRVDADAKLLQRAIINVIDNAARYGDEGGEIAISVSSSASEGEISIRDSGPGISADMLPRVFDAFGLRSARGGLGLGLTVARAVCELHGGRIGVQSAGPGSEFTLRLPLAPADRASAPSGAGTQATSARHVAGRRILVADDNQAVRNSFAAILQEMGHDVRLASDGVQAVEVAEAWSPEFVIVDVHMPKIDGYGVARKLRARFPHGAMQLVMMSGTDLDPTTLQGAKQAGFDHCVDKTLAVQGIDALLRGHSPPAHA
jgi:CheY-like chemotaxis protein